ncbi:hypothetical protein [Massilia glaciei]|uniref:hypothetical protein n=1 Tax=Massilia glaciei TaxID=1524097 RepID=UPI0015E802DB|nr:hypothetical protein [Massilia glaciei]
MLEITLMRHGRPVPDTRAMSSRSRWRGRAPRKARLVARASSGPVLLVGHGIMNRLIAKGLLALGWHGTASPGGRHWQAGTFRLAR